MKFVWRGILFKLADGSRGPYMGNDEAAAKGAGHDLKGATHYLATRIRGLRYALQCLIDYKGFRMTAEAVLPVSSKSLRYGSTNAGRTVHNDDENLAKKLKAAAKKLNLRTHMVNDTELYSACDIEGHVGEGDSHYLLDFARTFPPESPKKVEHLSDILSDRTPVYVHIYAPPKIGIILSAKVPLEEHTLARKDILYQVLVHSTDEVISVSGDKLTDSYQSIFWRMLRPEFVKGDSEAMSFVGAQVEPAAAAPTDPAAEARQELDSLAPLAAPTLPRWLSEKPDEANATSSGATSSLSILPTISEKPDEENATLSGGGADPSTDDASVETFSMTDSDGSTPTLEPHSGHLQRLFATAICNSQEELGTPVPGQKQSFLSACVIRQGGPHNGRCAMRSHSRHHRFFCVRPTGWRGPAMPDRFRALPRGGENATDAAEGKSTNLPNALLDVVSFFADRGKPTQ
ncbi:unnamed protein product [Ectocarpus fasciculatus]